MTALVDLSTGADMRMGIGWTNSGNRARHIQVSGPQPVFDSLRIVWPAARLAGHFLKRVRSTRRGSPAAARSWPGTAHKGLFLVAPSRVGVCGAQAEEAEMRKLCQLTLESGETVWVNPLQIRRVQATHAGSRIDFDAQDYVLVNESAHQVASAVEAACGA